MKSAERKRKMFPFVGNLFSVSHIWRLDIVCESIEKQKEYKKKNERNGHPV